MKFENKVAVVTGAGGTLCSEASIYLAQNGAKVVLIGRTEAKLQVVADKIESFGGQYLIIPANVVDEAEMTAVAKKVEETFGLCDFLINGAGGNNNRAITTNFTSFSSTAELDFPRNRCPGAFRRRSALTSFTRCTTSKSLALPGIP